MSFIFARWDEPQGNLYHYHPKAWKNSADMEEFVEMCFYSQSLYYSFVVLTTVSNETVKDIHDRMALILAHEQVQPCLTDSQAALQLLIFSSPFLQCSSEDGQLRFENLM